MRSAIAALKDSRGRVKDAKVNSVERMKAAASTRYPYLEEVHPVVTSRLGERLKGGPSSRPGTMVLGLDTTNPFRIR